MNSRILIALAILAAMLLVACGGGGGSDGTPTATATIEPTPTPEPVACTESNLYGALVSADEVNGAPLLTIGITNTLSACYLSGPPTVNWYDAAGTKLAVPDATSVPCQPQAGDYTTCVYDKQVVLPGGAATPAAGDNGQAVAVVGVLGDDSCASPAATAHFVGLQFPNINLDVQVELSADLVVPTCDENVTLYGFGPLATPQE